MIASIRHIGLVVFNLEESIKFWCETLGFSVFKRMLEEGETLDRVMGLENVKVETVKLTDANGNMLELLKFHSHPDKKNWKGMPYTTGLTHIAITVNDIENAYKVLRINVVNFLNSPQVSADKKVKVIYAKGPEGLLLEVVQQLN